MNFQRLWKKLEITNDAFIRTTDEEHVAVVQELLQKLYDKGEIERRTYEGWYCTPDERFWTEKEIVEGKCPDCGRPVERITEDNYFFLMSKYQEPAHRAHRKEPGLYPARKQAQRGARVPEDRRSSATFASPVPRRGFPGASNCPSTGTS